jgi:hypothetical protein
MAPNFPGEESKSHAMEESVIRRGIPWHSPST